MSISWWHQEIVRELPKTTWSIFCEIFMMLTIVKLMGPNSSSQVFHADIRKGERKKGAKQSKSHTNQSINTTDNCQFLEFFPQGWGWNTERSRGGGGNRIISIIIPLDRAWHCILLNFAVIHTVIKAGNGLHCGIVIQNVISIVLSHSKVSYWDFFSPKDAWIWIWY